MATEKKGRRKANPKKESRLEKENYTELNPRSESIGSEIKQAQIVIQRLHAKYKHKLGEHKEITPTVQIIKTDSPSPSKVSKIQGPNSNNVGQGSSVDKQQDTSVHVTPTKNSKGILQRRVNPRPRRKLVSQKSEIKPEQVVLKECSTNVPPVGIDHTPLVTHPIDTINTPSNDVIDTPSNDVIDMPSNDVIDSLSNDVIDTLSDVIDTPSNYLVTPPISPIHSTTIPIATPLIGESFDYSFNSPSPETKIVRNPSYMKILDFKTPVVERKKKGRRRNNNKKPPSLEKNEDDWVNEMNKEFADIDDFELIVQ